MTRKSSLTRRFLWLYLSLVVLPIIALSLMVLYSSFQAFTETVKSAARTSCQQTKQLLEYYVNNVNEMTNSLLGSDDFRKVLEKENTQAGTREQIQDMLYIRRMLGTCSSRKEVDEVFLFLDNEALYIGENSQTRHLSDAKSEAWFSYVEDSYPESVLIPGESMGNTEQIGYAKAIRSMRNYNRTTGIILFVLNRNLLARYLGEADGSLAYVVNEKGNEIVTKKNAADIALPEDYLPAEADGERFEMGREKWFLFSARLENTDWYLICLEPYVTLNQMMEQRGFRYLLFLVGILALGVLFYRLFSRMYLKRLASMREHMSASELPAAMEPGKRGDEIDDLVVSYNDMINRLEQLMKEQYRLGNQIREAELKALYEQINPHFLYNTLAMINWLAEDGRIDEVSEVITALSSFYRLSLNKGNENIYLKEELQIAENFVLIQQMRFGTDIRLTAETDPIYENFVLPKLTLQPLVENALVHGILKRRDKSGEIRIDVTDREGKLLITVSNNGIPIPEEVIQKLNDGTLQTSGRHYGIWNVVQRASLFYGSSCALAYSTEDGWTKAVLALPFAVNVVT